MFRTFLLCLTVLTANTVVALDPRKEITQYIHEVWTQDRGLPMNHITTAVQTKDGYLWFGMLEGLARFDGVRFELFDKTNTKELRNNLIWELLAAIDGSLWIGTFGGGVTRFREGKFTHYGTADGLADNIIISMLEDRQGRIWIGTRDGGLSCFENGRFVSYGTPQGLIHNTINTLFQDDRDQIWIGSDGGLCYPGTGKVICRKVEVSSSYNEIHSFAQDDSGTIWIGSDGGAAKILPDKSQQVIDEMQNIIVQTLLKDRAGNLWLGTDHGIYRWKNGEFTHFGEKQQFYLLYEDRDGNIWTASASGLGRIANNKLSFFTKANGLAGHGINSIIEDSEGSLWIATSAGLSRLRNGKFVTYTTDEGLSTNEVGPIYEDAKKNLWIGTNRGGLILYKDGGFSFPFSDNKELSASNLFALCKDHENALWVGSGNGVFRIQNNRLEHYLERDRLPDGSSRCIYQDSQGKIWIGTGAGLARWNHGSFVPYTVQHGLSNPVVRFIFEDSKHNLWIGTDGGLNLLKNEHFRVFAEKDGLTGIVLRTIYEDSDGVLWIGTIGNGLFRFQDGRFTNITSRHGLPDDTIFQILEDDHSNLWMSCNKGIFSVPRKDLKKSNLNATSIHFYNKTDGMKTSECRSAVYPAGWKTSDGHLWFPTDVGLVRIDPSNIPFNHVAPPVVLEKMVVDEKLQIGSGKRFPPGKEKFEFHYTALSFAAPERVKFRYILEGYDTNWTDAGSRRVAFYTHIPPGRYNFKVIACNNDGIWNTNAAAISFSLNPHFYQTFWFYGLCVLATTFLVFGLHSLRLKQLRSRFAAVITERNRISREIHDTLSQSLTAISLHLKTAEETLNDDQSETKQHVKTARTLARNSQVEARRFLQDLRPHFLETSDLPTAIKHAIDEIHSTVPVTLRVHGIVRKLPDRSEAHILRIAQEALANSVKHSDANLISVELIYKSDSVVLQVQDNGKGFDPSQQTKPGHFGLTGMSERIAEVRGKFSILSEQGKGTTVKAEIPLSGNS